MSLVKSKTKCVLISFISLFLWSSVAFSADSFFVIPIKSQQTANNSYFEQIRTIENLETDWTFYYSGSNATFTQVATTSNAVLNGTSAQTDFAHAGKDSPAAKGIIGTINLSSINKASAGFGMYIGTLNEYHVHTNLNFTESDGSLNIRYKIRLADSNRNLLSTLAWGYVPAQSSIGQDIRLGFSKIENSVCFYINGEQLFKWEPTETIGPRGLTDVWYWEWVDAASDAIASAIFKDISIIK